VAEAPSIEIESEHKVSGHLAGGCGLLGRSGENEKLVRGPVLGSNAFDLGGAGVGDTLPKKPTSDALLLDGSAHGYSATLVRGSPPHREN
jgi:hypothetical protein